MLSQFDNENSNRIRRSKSASSVKERRKHPIISEPLDPDSARVQALIAAHRAMDRSRGSASDDLRRSDSTTSKSSAKQAQIRNAGAYSPAAQLRRQRSVLQATTPSLAASLPVPSIRDAATSEHTTYTQIALSEFGPIYEGEPSSFRRLRTSASVLSPSRG